MGRVLAVQPSTRFPEAAGAECPPAPMRPEHDLDDMVSTALAWEGRNLRCNCRPIPGARASGLLEPADLPQHGLIVRYLR